MRRYRQNVREDLRHEIMDNLRCIGENKGKNEKLQETLMELPQVQLIIIKK